MKTIKLNSQFELASHHKKRKMPAPLSWAGIFLFLVARVDNFALGESLAFDRETATATFAVAF